MPIVKLTPADQIILDLIGTESDDALRHGVQIEPSTPYLTTITPSPNWNTTVPSGSDIQTNVKEGTSFAAAILYRYVSPVNYQSLNVNPSFTVNTLTTLMTYVIPDKMEVARKVKIDLNLLAYSSDIDTESTYWVEVNGSPLQSFKYLYKQANIYNNSIASWITTLPLGTVTITAKLNKTAGLGSIILDSSSNINLTITG